MEKATLVAHRDTQRVSEDVVRAEPQPAFTPTWHPFSHGAVLDAIGRACGKLELKVVNKLYSIRRNAKMFGVWENGFFNF